MFTLCFTAHVIIVNFFVHLSIGHTCMLSCRTCLARERFPKPISCPWPKKVVHYCITIIWRCLSLPYIFLCYTICFFLTLYCSMLFLLAITHLVFAILLAL